MALDRYSSQTVQAVRAALSTNGLRAGEIHRRVGIGSVITTRHILRELVSIGEASRSSDPADKTGHRQLYRSVALEPKNDRSAI